MGIIKIAIFAYTAIVLAAMPALSQPAVTNDSMSDYFWPMVSVIKWIGITFIGITGISLIAIPNKILLESARRVFRMVHLWFRVKKDIFNIWMGNYFASKGKKNAEATTQAEFEACKDKGNLLLPYVSFLAEDYWKIPIFMVEEALTRMLTGNFDGPYVPRGYSDNVPDGMHDFYKHGDCAASEETLYVNTCVDVKMFLEGDEKKSYLRVFLALPKFKVNEDENTHLIMFRKHEVHRYERFGHEYEPLTVGPMIIIDRKFYDREIKRLIIKLSKRKLMASILIDENADFSEEWFDPLKF